MAEKSFAFFIVTIFIGLLLSLNDQKHIEELEEAIKGIEGQGKEMENFIKDEYKINSVDEAISELENLKAGLVKFIYSITASLK